MQTGRVRFLPRTLGTVRTRLIALALLPLLPAGGVALVIGARERSETASATREQARQLARATAEDVRSAVAGLEGVLATVSRLDSVRSGDASACNELVEELATSQPSLADLGAATASGSITCSTRRADARASVARAAWFRQARRRGGFALGRFEGGAERARPVLTAGHPIGMDGRGPVVFGSLDLLELSGALRRIRAPSRGTLTVFDDRGVVLARYPSPGRFIGRRLPLTRRTRAVVERGSGLVEAAGLDGVERVFAIAPAALEPGGAILASAGLSEEDALDDPNRDLLFVIGAITIGASLAVVALSVGSRRLIGRWIIPVVGAAHGIARGDTRSRAGPPYGQGELGRLARTFDQMADSIDRREEERDRFLQQLVSAQEDERRRIAAGIHDDPVQALSAMRLRLEALRDELTTDSQVALAQELDEAIGDTTRRLRELLFELRTPQLETVGLAEAIRDELHETQRLTGVATALEDGLRSEPEQGVRGIIFRIVREALANVRKHSGATSVVVRLETTHDVVRAVVVDDGRGFHPGGEPGPGHVGIATMRERAAQAGAQLEIHSAPGEGTRVTLEIPV